MDKLTCSEPELSRSDSDIEIKAEAARRISAKPIGGRGRPITTGGYEMKKVIEKRNAIKAENKQQERLLGLMDGTTPLTESSQTKTKTTKKWLDVQEEKENYYRTANTTEIAEEALKVAQKRHTVVASTNIKGTLVKEMKCAVATINAALTAMHQRADEGKAREDIEELLKQLNREKKEKERLQEKLQEKCKQYEKMEQQFEIKQIREHTMKGIPIPDSLGIEAIRKEKRDELQRASLPPCGGEALNNSEEGVKSSPHPSKDGGEFKKKREQRATHPLKSGEALGSLQEIGEEDRSSKEKEIVKPNRAGKRKAPPQVQLSLNQPTKKAAPRVVSDIMVAPPNNMDTETQSILMHAEKKADQLRNELNDLLAQIARIRQGDHTQNKVPTASISANTARTKVKQPKSGKTKEEKGQAKKVGNPGSKVKPQTQCLPLLRRGKRNRRLLPLGKPLKRQPLQANLSHKKIPMRRLLRRG